MKSAREARLAEGTVKTLTGGNDSITARHLYKGFFDFEPQFKLWLATNHQPTICTDAAIWDRMRLIPFTVRFEEAQQDKNLATTLKLEAQGIIQWAVTGFQHYVASGLPETEEIEAATASYKAEQNPVAIFIRECCTMEETLHGKPTVKRADLYNAYQQWTMDNDEKMLSRRDFNQEIRKTGVGEKHTKTDGDVWVGLSLVEHEECNEDDAL